MSKPDYTAFDAELLRLIAAGQNQMMLLDSRHGDNQRLRDLALPHCKVINGRPAPAGHQLAARPNNNARKGWRMK